MKCSPFPKEGSRASACAPVASQRFLEALTVHIRLCGPHPPEAVSLGLITVPFMKSKMLMINLVCFQTDAKIAATGNDY